MPPKKREKTSVPKLTPEQLAKLESLAQPDRWVDESFHVTEIGAFLLKAQLIAPNPEKGTRRAYIVTDEGLRALKEAK